MLLTGLTCLRAQRRFTAVLCGGKRCQKVSEAAALRSPESSYEALLLSAGKYGQSPSCRKRWGKSCICQHTNTQSHLYKRRHLGAISSSTSLSEAHPQQSLLLQEQSGCKSAAPAISLSLAPQPSTSCRSWLSPLSCTNTCSPPRLFFSQKPSGSRAEQLPHH